MWKVNFEKKKNPVLPIQKFPSVVLPRNAIMLHLIVQFLLYYLSNGRLREVKNKWKFRLSFLKVVTVAYESWSLTRGSKYSDLTWKLLVFWKTGRWGEVVAYERWSQPAVRLYLVLSFDILFSNLGCWTSSPGISATSQPLLLLHVSVDICFVKMAHKLLALNTNVVVFTGLFGLFQTTGL